MGYDCGLKSHNPAHCQDFCHFGMDSKGAYAYAILAGSVRLGSGWV